MLVLNSAHASHRTHPGTRPHDPTACARQCVGAVHEPMHGRACGQRALLTVRAPPPTHAQTWTLGPRRCAGPSWLPTWWVVLHGSAVILRTPCSMSCTVSTLCMHTGHGVANLWVHLHGSSHGMGVCLPQAHTRAWGICGAPLLLSASTGAVTACLRGGVHKQHMRVHACAHARRT